MEYEAYLNTLTRFCAFVWKRIRIRIKVKGRIRIRTRIKVKGWIRFRIKSDKQDPDPHPHPAHESQKQDTQHWLEKPRSRMDPFLFELLDPNP